MNKKKSTNIKTLKSMKIFIACLVMVPALFCRASINGKINDSETNPALKIYLPREVTIKDSNLKLGSVSIIRGSEPLAAKAGEIALGRISVPGQKIVIDRPMLLSRLATNGIDASNVTFTGSEKITVTQQNRTISSDEFVTLANSLLQKNPPDKSTCSWNLVRKPKDFVVSEGSRDIKLSPRLVQTGSKNHARIEIAILSESKKIGVRQVTFIVTFNCHQAVTKVDIPAGGIISPENITIETVQSNNPEPFDWKPPYGQVTKRPLQANTVLGQNMLENPKTPVIVKRNQNVVIRIESPGFLITASGKTLQDGKAGEFIKVRNVDSQRIILVRISEDGSVEPVL